MDPEFDYELEADIVDQHCQTETETDFLGYESYDVPSRPTSRLSFNRPMIDSPSYTEEETTALHLSISRAQEQAGERLQDIGRVAPDDAGMDITTLAPRDVCPGALKSLLASNLHVDEGEEVDYDSMNLNNDYEDTDPGLGSSYLSRSSSDEESNESSILPLQNTPLNTSFTSFATPPLSDYNAWVASPKFSCLPSPLSPGYFHPKPFSFRHQPRRHGYQQHGYSRHALLYLKYFWANRKEEWVAHTSQLDEPGAYGGLAVFKDMITPTVLRLPGCRPFDRTGSVRSTQDMAQPLPPLTIHPRRGDLCALRDPYSAHIDRLFVGMQLWTMGKVLWMYDMHIAYESRIGTSVGNQEQSGPYSTPGDDYSDEEQSEGDSIETSVSTGSSNDSDITLVESESEENVLKYTNARGYGAQGDNVELIESDMYIKNHGTTSKWAAMHSEHSHNGDGQSGPTTPQRTACTCSHLQSSDTTPPWTTCWYCRWDLLAELVRKGCEPLIPRALHVNQPPSTKVNKLPRFYIADEDEDCEDEDEYDMEDISFMINPLFRGASVALHS